MQKRTKWAKAFAIVLGVVVAGCLVGPAAAQTVTGSIYGTVTDATGAIVPGAAVIITDTGTGVSATAKSNASGQFIFPVVQPGIYKATAAMAGFSTLTQTDLRVAANQNVNASFKLQAGAVSSEVTVEANSALIDTRESQIAETIDQERIVDLPLAGRNAYDLVQLIPGVTNYASGSQIGDNGGTTFSVNGIRPNFNSFYLDGSYNTSFFRGGGNIVPAPDALSEFRIITSNFDAEFGRYPGAVVNTITRSGANTMHGVAYDYIRNAIFNARNYFSQANLPKVQYIYNVFGGGVGGAVVKDKLFYFLSYQGTKIHQQTIINPGAIIVPTDAERTGDFSMTTGVAKPSTAVCPAYHCPVDVVTQNILKYVPHADLTQTTTNALGNVYHPSQQIAPNPISANQGTARFDYNMNAAHRLSLTYFNSQGTGFNRVAGGNQLLNYSGVSTYAGQTNYVLSDIWTVSSRAVNTATVFYTLNKTISANVFNTGTFSDLGSAIKDGGPISTQPMITVTGFFVGGVGGSGPDTQAQLETGVEDTFNYTRGNHTLKAGGSTIFNRYDETASFLSSTKETFNGNAIPTGYTVKSGNALADFIQGHAQTFQQNSGSLHRLHAWDPSLFVQDDWRVTRRLTLNLGLRWEIYYPFSGQGDFGSFQAGVQSTRFPTAPKGLLLEGDPGVPAGVLNTSLKKFAPRVGFAMDVFGNGKTSLRGAYGLFYSFSQETFVGNLEQQPFTLALTLNNTTNFTNPYAGQASFPNGSPFPYTPNLQNPTFTTGATFSGLPPNESAIPYVQQYNLTLEQQFGDNWSTRMSYIGNTGRHFYIARDQNSPVYAAGATVANEPNRRPLYGQGYTAAVGLLDPSSNSSYNSLQLEVTRRLKRGFSLQAFYVWSKAFDDASSDPGSATAYSLANQNNVGMDRGLSTLDVPQRFVASFIYHAPDVHHFGLIGKEVLSGWQLNGIETLATGSPFNVLSNTDSNLDSLTTGDRPNLIGNNFLGFGRPKLAKIAEFFNTAAYAAPPAGQPYGTSPRDPMVGPGQVETDISAFKRFQVYERYGLLYRVEVFNLFNNTNLNNPNGTLGNANFGKITSAGNPRFLQMALKFEF